MVFTGTIRHNLISRATALNVRVRQTVATAVLSGDRRSRLAAKPNRYLCLEQPAGFKGCVAKTAIW
jgi:hypothetical protein